MERAEPETYFIIQTLNTMKMTGRKNIECLQNDTKFFFKYINS